MLRIAGAWVRIDSTSRLVRGSASSALVTAGAAAAAAATRGVARLSKGLASAKK